MSKNTDRNLRRKQRRLECQAAGICIDCCKRPAANGKQKCEPCIERYNELAAASYARRYKARQATGLCVWCGLPAVPGRTRCEPCAAKQNARNQKYDHRDRKARKAGGVCVECGRKPAATGYQRCDQCRDQFNLLQQRRNQEIKDAAFARYGGYICDCCGETNKEFLQIDHIGGTGGEHRREDPTARRIYSWLRKHKYPEGFRVLCSNCNWAIGKYGYCPHQKPTDGTHGNHTDSDKPPT